MLGPDRLNEAVHIETGKKVLSRIDVIIDIEQMLFIKVNTCANNYPVQFQDL